MKKRELLAIVLLLLSGLFVKCSEEKTTNPVESEIPSGDTEGVSNNFISLQDNVTINNYNNTSGNVSLTYTGKEPKFIENASVIVVDLDTIGYLRKVVSVQKQGNTINLVTKQAYFSDVFKSKSFKLSTKSYVPNTSLQKTSTNAEISKALTDENGFIHPEKVVYHSRLGKVITQEIFSPESINDSFRVIDINKDFSNTDLYGEQGDNVHFYISEGYALFQSDAVFEFETDYTGEFEPDTKIEKSELKKFKFYLDSKAEFLTKLNLDMQASYSKEGNPRIFDMKKVTLKFFVAAVPVWITMDCDIYGKYTLSSDAKLHTNWGFKSTHELKIGGIYTKATDDFTPISEYVPTNEIFPLNIEGEINANARFEIYPRAEVLFYSFFGPYAEVVPYVEGNYNAAYQSFNNNFLAWNSNVNLGLDMRVGLKLTFLWGLYDEEFAAQVINCFNTTLWAAPYELTLLSNIPASSSVNSSIELKYKVIDKLGNPVLAVPIHFSGDGTTSSSMEITNIGGEATVSWNVGNSEGEQKLTATIYNANGTIIQQLNHSTVIASNNHPNQPTSPNPVNNSTGVSTSATLSWNCSDPDGDPLTYDIYFGSSSNPPLVKSNHSSKSYNPGMLSENTKYYWKIVAKDNQDHSTKGNIWEFSTGSGQPTPTQGLVAYYPFNGNANDESGNNNNGTVSGASLTSDRFGHPNSAYQFSGSDYIKTQPSQSFPIGSMDRTISVWVKSSNYAVPNKFLVGWGTLSHHKMCALVFGLGNKASSKPGFWGWVDDIPSNSTLNNNIWYHIVFVHKNGIGKLYINGKLDAEKELKLDTPSKTALYISGSRPPMSYFNGIIDDIRIYSNALSESEINDLYHEGGW